jgi:hypothetical protein
LGSAYPFFPSQPSLGLSSFWASLLTAQQQSPLFHHVPPSSFDSLIGWARCEQLSAPTPFFVAPQQQNNSTRAQSVVLRRGLPYQRRRLTHRSAPRPAPRSDDRHRAAPRRGPTPPRKGAESRSASPGGGSGTRCRHRGTLARSPGGHPFSLCRPALQRRRVPTKVCSTATASLPSLLFETELPNPSVNHLSVL